jgi:hypothetical protein
MLTAAEIKIEVKKRTIAEWEAETASLRCLIGFSQEPCPEVDRMQGDIAELERCIAIEKRKIAALKLLC